MKLLSLKLHNFRQFVDADFLIPQGLVAIIGDNGAGKTTIIESIIFALFGAKSIRGKLDDLRSRTTSENVQLGEPKVVLTFELSSIVYRVERSTSEASIFAGGETVPLAKGSTAVTETLSRLLKLNREEFIATFYTEQKGLEFLSGKKSPAERERFIVRMMGYDRLENMQELLREEKKIIKATTSGYDASLGDRDQLVEKKIKEEASLKTVQEKLEEQQKLLDKLLSDMESEKEKFQAVEKGFAQWTKLNQDISKEEAVFNEKTSNILRLEKQLKELPDTTLVEENLEKKRAEFETVQDAKNLIKNKILEHQSALKQREQKTSLQIEQYSEEEKKLSSRLAQISSLLSKAICDTCGQPIGESVDKIQLDINQQLNLLKEKKLSIQKTDQDESEKIRQFIKKDQSQLVALEENINQLKQYLLELEKNLNYQASKVAYQNELERLRQEVVLCDQTLKELKKEKSGLKINDTNYLAAKAKITALESMINIARLQKVELEGEFKANFALVERCEKEIREYDDKSEKLLQLKARLLVLEEGDEILTAFRKSLNESIRPTLAMLASDFLTELTDGRYTEVFIGPDFAPTVFDDGQIKTVISGGETDILYLCVRLALSQLLAERAGHPLSLLILDEVFGSLDTQRRINVLQLLEKLKTRFEQIIIITHMDDTRDAVEHLIEVRFDSTNGTSTVDSRDYSSLDW